MKNKKDLVRVKKLIAKYKAQLFTAPMVENFGQSLVCRLREEFSDYAYGFSAVLTEINDFDDWCQNRTTPFCLKRTRQGTYAMGELTEDETLNKE